MRQRRARQHTLLIFLIRYAMRDATPGYAIRVDSYAFDAFIREREALCCGDILI